MGNVIRMPGTYHTTTTTRNKSNNDKQPSITKPAAITLNNHQQRRSKENQILRESAKIMQSERAYLAQKLNDHECNDKINSMGNDQRQLRNDKTTHHIRDITGHCKGSTNKQLNLLPLSDKNECATPADMSTSHSISSHNECEEEDSILNNDDEGTNYYFSSTDSEANDESSTNQSTSYCIAPSAAESTKKKLSNRTSVIKAANIVSNNIHVLATNKNDESDYKQLECQPGENKNSDTDYCMQCSTVNSDDEEGQNYYFSSSGDASDTDGSILPCIAPSAIINIIQ